MNGENNVLINEIRIKNDGYIDCKSNFYRAIDILNESIEYTFTKGTNMTIGEIDSGNWGISYLISMYKSINSKTLFLPLQALVNNRIMDLSELAKYACYMDESCPMFSSKKTIRKMVESGLIKSGISKSSADIRQLFQITDVRFDRTLNEVGNERFKAMAAIAYSSGKQVYCFPWLSKKRFDYYQQNMTDLLCILDSLNMMSIVPVGQ